MRKPRHLLIEPLECRQLLSVAPVAPPDPDPFAAYLAAETPNPHPTGDQPSDTARSFRCRPTLRRRRSSIRASPARSAVEGLQQIYSNILNNPQARPSFWGETADAGGDVYRLHLCDNGMLIQSWTINWGDGSAPQVVSQSAVGHASIRGRFRPVRDHRHRLRLDGTYPGGTATRRARWTRASIIPTRPARPMRLPGTHNPDWANQIGSVGQQTTNFESNTGFDQGSAVALDNGNILVAGTTGSGQFGLVRYVVDPGQSDDGNPDPNFGTSGLVTTTFSVGNATATAVAVSRQRLHCRGRHGRGQQRPR